MNKRITINFIGFMACILLLASCTVRQEYDFTGKEKGRYKMEVDFTSMSAMVGEDGNAMKDAMDSINTDSIAEEMDNHKGISNTKILTDNNVFSMGYDFSSLEALNRSMQANSIDDYLNNGLGHKEKNQTHC